MIYFFFAGREKTACVLFSQPAAKKKLCHVPPSQHTRKKNYIMFPASQHAEKKNYIMFAPATHHASRASGASFAKRASGASDASGGRGASGACRASSPQPMHAQKECWAPFSRTDPRPMDVRSKILGLFPRTGPLPMRARRKIGGTVVAGPAHSLCARENKIISCSFLDHGYNESAKKKLYHVPSSQHARKKNYITFPCVHVPLRTSFAKK